MNPATSIPLLPQCGQNLTQSVEPGSATGQPGSTTGLNRKVSTTQPDNYHCQLSLHNPNHPEHPTQALNLALGEPSTEVASYIPNKELNSFKNVIPSAVQLRNGAGIGPQYDAKTGTDGQTMWVRNDNVHITTGSTNWPELLTNSQVAEYFENKQGIILFYKSSPVSSNSNHSSCLLDANCPSNNDKWDWFKFYSDPARNVENALEQVFGNEGAQYLEQRLDSLVGSLEKNNEPAQKWQQLCQLLKHNQTCGLPYDGRTNGQIARPDRSILEFLLIQENEPSNEKAKAMREEMVDFLKQQGIEGELYHRYWPVKLSQTRGMVAYGQMPLQGTTQLLLTPAQARQLFSSLQSFINDNK